jgi:hypothetical protein
MPAGLGGVPLAVITGKMPLGSPAGTGEIMSSVGMDPIGTGETWPPLVADEVVPDGDADEGADEAAAGDVREG